MISAIADMSMIVIIVVGGGAQQQQVPVVSLPMFGPEEDKFVAGHVIMKGANSAGFR